jgi:branched-chain amino acid transport system permease protein
MLLAQQVLNGLLDGVYYLLIALGLSLIFSLGGIVNLAHGAFFAIGAYLTLVISPYLGFSGALVLSPVAVALLGVVIERLLFQRFYRADPILSLLLTFGLAMVAEQALRMIFGAPPLSYSIPQALRGQVFIGSFIYSFYRVVLLGIAAGCIAGLWVLLRLTPFGRVVRAGVQNPDSHIWPALLRSVSALRDWQACCLRRSMRSIPPWGMRSSRRLSWSW